MPHLTDRCRVAARVVAGLALVTALAACSQGGAATVSSAPATSSPPAVSAASPSSAATGMMASGMFHDVDGAATGEAQLVVKPDGGYEIALESFSIGAIAHIDVVLVSNTDVKATADVDKSKLLDLGPLKATEGMQDFPIPADMASGVMDGYHTVVLWDTEMAHAVAAAPLK